MGQTIRTTISVPKALKARMEEFPAVNWSGIASRAFVREVERLSGESLGDIAPLSHGELIRLVSSLLLRVEGLERQINEK